MSLLVATSVQNISHSGWVKFKCLLALLGWSLRTVHLTVPSCCCFYSFMEFHTTHVMISTSQPFKESIKHISGVCSLQGSQLFCTLVLWISTPLSLHVLSLSPPLSQLTPCNLPPAPTCTSSHLLSWGTQYYTTGCPVSERNCFIILYSFLILYSRKVFLIPGSPSIDRIRIPRKLYFDIQGNPWCITSLWSL